MSSRGVRSRLAAALSLLTRVRGVAAVLPQAARSRCRSTWKVEAPWREGTPSDAAPKGRVVAALRRSRSSTRCIAKALAQTARRSRWRMRGSRRRERWSRRRRRDCFRRSTSRARATRQRISANRPLTQLRARPTSRRSRTTSCSRSAVELRGRPLRPRAEHDRRRARAAPSRRRPISRTRASCSTTDLATAYFNLRQIDIELDVLARSIALQRRSLEFVTNRHDLGAASGLDVAQQQALIDTTLTQLDVLRRQRAQFENAVATLTGTPAPSFSLAPDIARADAAADSGRRAFRRPRAPARRRCRGARDGRGQRADRRRQGGVLPEHHDRPPTSAIRADRWRGCSTRRARSGRSARQFAAAALHCRPARRERRVRASRTTTRPSRTTGASS